MRALGQPIGLGRSTPAGTSLERAFCQSFESATGLQAAIGTWYGVSRATGRLRGALTEALRLHQGVHPIPPPRRSWWNSP